MKNPTRNQHHISSKWHTLHFGNCNVLLLFFCFLSLLGMFRKYAHRYVQTKLDFF